MTDSEKQPMGERYLIQWITQTWMRHCVALTFSLNCLFAAQSLFLTHVNVEFVRKRWRLKIQEPPGDWTNEFIVSPVVNSPHKSRDFIVCHVSDIRNKKYAHENRLLLSSFSSCFGKVESKLDSVSPSKRQIFTGKVPVHQPGKEASTRY